MAEATVFARAFTADELAARSGVDPYLLHEVLEGEEGFVALGLVRRCPGGYMLTEAGRDVSAGLAGEEPVSAARKVSY